MVDNRIEEKCKIEKGIPVYVHPGRRIKKKNRILFLISFFCFFVSMVLFAGALSVRKITGDNRNVRMDYEKKESVFPTGEQTEYERRYYEIKPEDLSLLRRYREINDEVVGVITIPGTILHHPLMQSPNRGESFYLSHDLYGNHNFHGVPFLTLDSDLSREDGNNIIYGHNIIHTEPKDVFCDLVNYENLDYYKEHPVIEVITNRGTAKYLIFSYVVMDTSDSDAFVYWEDVNFDSQSAFNEYMEAMQKRNWLDVDVPRTRFDSYLTISTCSLELAHSGTNRMVVMAKRLAVDEDYSCFVQNARMNDNPLLPQKLR